MSEKLLEGLTLIIVLGVAAQWFAWRFRLPSILLLLSFGFLAGPVLEIIKPSEILGDLVLPIVSISVAVILFEGGLSLRVSEIRGVTDVVRNLVSIGALVTWVLASLAARLFLYDGRADDLREPLSWPLCILLGAVLVVTGPTVIVPLLRHIRPKGRLESVLRWEGIVMDPIGATLAVLVFEGVLAFRQDEFSTGNAILGFLLTMGAGGGAGIAGAFVLYSMLKRFLIPDFLQNPATLMFVVGVFYGANLLYHESGVFAVTVMGIALANQRRVAVKHIVEFKENLQVLLISFLFIVLSAGLERDHLSQLNVGMFGFLLALILVVRPLSVFLSTLRSSLDWRERTFLAIMAPRGIVAAAVASVFSLGLIEQQVAQAELLLPMTFMVIIGSVAFYGLVAPLVARWLGLAEANPQGTVIVGAHPWARAIAKALLDNGCKVLLVDTNRVNLKFARMEGLATHYGNVLGEHALDSMPLDGMGRLLALTANDEVNALAALRFREQFGSAETYQLVTNEEESAPDDLTPHLRGRYLPEGLSFNVFQQRWTDGATIKSTKITEEFGFESFSEHYGETAIPLFLIDSNSRVTVLAKTLELTPAPGRTLVSLVDEPEPEPEPERKGESASPQG